MQSSSRGVSARASPPPPGATPGSGGSDPPLASRRTSKSPWPFPRASVDASRSTMDRRLTVSRHGSAQADDYRTLRSSTSSIFSGTETVAPQSRSGSTERSGRRGPYGLLSGLLSRRGGDAKPRGHKSDAGTSAGVSPTAAVKPSTRATRNPLVDGYDRNGNGSTTGWVQMGAGGYDWPTPPSPIKASESLHHPASSSRHESVASPLLSLQSHSTPLGTTGREQRPGGAAANAGESSFVPLGNTDLARRAGSASLRRPDGDDATAEEALSTSGVGGRSGQVGRRRHFGPGPVAAESPSDSQSQSNELPAHARGSQVRMVGVEENEKSSSSNVRSMRDAKAALLRHAQGLNGSMRTSRQQSFRRVPSNMTGADTVAPASHRPSKARATSRDRRSLNGSRNGGSLYSIPFEDDAVRMSISPGSTGSPLTGRHAVLFPASATNPDGNLGSTSNAGTSRRFSRTEDGSGQLMEVMETSGMASHGSAARTTRGRSTTSQAKSSLGGGHNGNSSRDDAVSVPSVSARSHSLNPRNPHVPSGPYNDSVTGEDSSEREERHRQKVDEVLRMLHRPKKSITGNNQSTMSRGDAVEAATANRDAAESSHGGNGNGNSMSNADVSNNASGAWSGIGGMGWGGLAGFGSAAADTAAADSTASAGTGGWAGLGGDGGSDDWYARMRKKAEEDERAEAAAAAPAEAAAASGSKPSSPSPTPFVTSPGTVSMTVAPGAALQGSPLPPTAVRLTPSNAAAEESTGEQGSAIRRLSAVSLARSQGGRPSPSPASPGAAPANATPMPTRPAGPTRAPTRPSLPTTASSNGTTTVSALGDRFVRRPPGVAGRAAVTSGSPSARVGGSLTELSMENVVSLRTPASYPRGEDSNGSASLSGRQSTLPAVASTTVPPVRRPSRPTGFLAAAVTVNASGDGSEVRARQETRPPPHEEMTGLLHGLPPRRPETTTPPQLSTPSSGTASTGTRRFDYRRRGSLPRVLPTATGPGTAGTAAATSSSSTAGGAATATGTNSVLSVSSVGPAAHPLRSDRLTLAPPASANASVKSTTQPALSSFTLGAAPPPPANAAKPITAPNTTSGPRRHSSPIQSTAAPTPRVAGRPDSAAAQQATGTPSSGTPQRRSVSAAAPKAVVAATRLHFS